MPNVKKGLAVSYTAKRTANKAGTRSGNLPVRGKAGRAHGQKANKNFR